MLKEVKIQTRVGLRSFGGSSDMVWMKSNRSDLAPEFWCEKPPGFLQAARPTFTEPHSVPVRIIHCAFGGFGGDDLNTVHFHHVGWSSTNTKTRRGRKTLSSPKGIRSFTFSWRLCGGKKKRKAVRVAL